MSILVFSRRKDEVVHIGDSEVIVLEVREGGKVRLGIRAPRAVPVHRGELHDIHVECDERTMRTVWGEVESAN